VLRAWPPEGWGRLAAACGHGLGGWLRSGFGTEEGYCLAWVKVCQNEEPLCVRGSFYLKYPKPVGRGSG